jgi:hypothetical protein
VNERLSPEAKSVLVSYMKWRWDDLDDIDMKRSSGEKLIRQLKNMHVIL